MKLPEIIIKIRQKKVVMRVFVAVEISNDDVKKSVKSLQDSMQIDAKPVSLEQLHFTMQFLGEISQVQAQEVIESLRAVKFSEFVVSLRGTGAFPKPKFPRTVWIGTDRGGGERLVELAKRVETALRPLGFAPDKPFRPHITVFRVKKKVGDITEELNAQNGDFGMQSVSSIKLKKSKLGSDGPSYSDLGEVAAVK